MRRPRRRSAVSIANDKVPITMACRLVGMDIDDDIAYGRSMKVHCPFGELYHTDQGVEPAFRIYVDSNSAYCFACSTYFTPVWLVSQAWDQQPAQVAVELLERIGIKPASLADAWAQAAVRDVVPDAGLLAEALKTFCGRICVDWDDAQFEPATAGLLSRCLALLDLVHTEGEARQWLDECKKVMRAALQHRNGLQKSTRVVDSR